MSHTYKKGKHELPSVTTIIGEATDKDGLVYWSANAAVDYLCEHSTGLCGEHQDEIVKTARTHFKTISKEALSIGSEVHACIESYLKYDDISFLRFPKSKKDESLSCLEAFEFFKFDHELKPLKLEYTVFGEGHWAGTMDFKGILDGKKTLIDFKTSKAIYWSSMGPQLGAYWVADGRWAEQAGILRLDKVTGEYELKLLQPKRLEKYYREFQHMVELYFERHPIIAKRAGVK